MTLLDEMLLEIERLKNEPALLNTDSMSTEEDDFGFTFEKSTGVDISWLSEFED